MSITTCPIGHLAERGGSRRAAPDPASGVVPASTRRGSRERPRFAPALCTIDTTTGALLRELELPQDANRAAALAVRPDGVVYVPGELLHVVHPDGRVEPGGTRSFPPAPFFATAGGGMMTLDGQRLGLVDGKFEYFNGLKDDARVATVSYDRNRLTFHRTLGPVQVWDVLTRSVVFSAAQRGALGAIPGWRGQSAASSASHVAAVDHTDASVAIWRIDQPDAPIATLRQYSQGARRLMFHGDALTVHTCQPPNTRDSVLQIDLTSGAAQRLERDHVIDMARTPDGQRLLVMHERGALQPLGVTLLDPAGAEVETLEVQRGAGELALAPGGATWGAVSHTYPPHGDPVGHAQWRGFGATKWAKNVKIRGRWQQLALCDSAAAVAIGDELTVVAFAKGKTLRTTTLPASARAVAISRDGANVGLACHDKPRIVHVATGTVTELQPEVAGERQFPRSVAFDEHGVWLFVGFPSGAITQHRVLTGALVATLHGHNDEVCALTWHDGHLWSGSEDGTILQWGALG